MIEPSIFDAPASALLEANFDAELLATVLAHWHETFMAAPQRDELLVELGLRIEDAHPEPTAEVRSTFARSSRSAGHLS
jgi:hypothetical protein